MPGTPQAGCVGLPLGVWGPYTDWTICQQWCESVICWQCCVDPHTGSITQLLLNANPCVCPPGLFPIDCDGNGPCAPQQCIPGYSWSYIHCNCVCDSQMCPSGYYWDYVDCMCKPNIMMSTDGTELRGTESELIVQIAEYTEKSIKEITFELFQAINELELQRTTKTNSDSRCKPCGGTSQQQATCVENGCLWYKTYKTDGSGILIWAPNDAPGDQTFNCVDGTCLEVNGNSGKFETFNDCQSYCGKIDEFGDQPSSYNLTPMIDEPITPTEEYLVPRVVAKTILYEAKTQINPLVGENQTACVPTTQVGASTFNTLEDCLNSGAAGWLASELSTSISIFGNTYKS